LLLLVLMLQLLLLLELALLLPLPHFVATATAAAVVVAATTFVVALVAPVLFYWRCLNAGTAVCAHASAFCWCCFFCCRL
jgi:hypothetical protein